MPRGGYREGSGGKPTWKHGKTKVIRVPEVLADKVIEYARQIDRLQFEATITKNLNVTQSKILNLAGIPTYSFEKGSGVYLADLISFGYQIKPDKLHESVISKDRLKQQSRVNQLKSQINEEIKNIE